MKDSTMDTEVKDLRGLPDQNGQYSPNIFEDEDHSVRHQPFLDTISFYNRRLLD